MADPVVVSRIQNRRGTQAQFDALYPTGYSGTGGFNDLTFEPATSILTLTATGTQVTFDFASSTPGLYPVNSEILVQGVTSVPANAYNGTYFVLSSTPTSVTVASTATASFTPGTGTIYFIYNLNNYPGILMPGELALCTDTRNVFLGNLNGEYIQLAAAVSFTFAVTPLVISLAPTATFTSWTTIPQLNFTKTPFYNILYDLTDQDPGINPDWNTTGSVFTRNGEMKITSLSTQATMVDSSTEINNSGFGVHFRAFLSGSVVQIQYVSSFPSNLTFSTTTINWVPF